MPMRLVTEPLLSNDTDDDSRVFAFCMCVTAVVGLAVITLVLSYHFR